MKQQYLIEYDCAHWCGGTSNVVVWAESPDEALYLAEDHMETEMRELFSEEYEDEPTDECTYSIISVEEFNESHWQWLYFTDPEQSQFYPIIGSPDHVAHKSART